MIHQARSKKLRQMEEDWQDGNGMMVPCKSLMHCTTKPSVITMTWSAPFQPSLCGRKNVKPMTRIKTDNYKTCMKKNLSAFNIWKHLLILPKDACENNHRNASGVPSRQWFSFASTVESINSDNCNNENTVVTRHFSIPVFLSLIFKNKPLGLTRVSG